jgi:PEGA domain-containing protein
MQTLRSLAVTLGGAGILLIASFPLMAASPYSMKELLSTQKFERVETPFPLPVHLVPVETVEGGGWNGALDDRWHSSDAFRGAYREEFLEGLGFYLSARGFEVSSSKDALQVRVTIDHFNGRKRIHDDGGDLAGTLGLWLHGKQIAKKPLFESLSYRDESDECPVFARQFGLAQVTFPTVLFYRLSVSFYASIAEGILGSAPQLDSNSHPSEAQMPSGESTRTGMLTIESTPDAAEIYLDSSLVATTPARHLRLGAGKHKLTLKKSGFADWTRDIIVLEDSDLTLKATLEKSQP